MTDVESIIVNFVKRNISLLQQDQYEDSYKDKKHDFFIREQKSKIGKPKDTEIAHVAVMFMLRRHLIKIESDLDKVLAKPFFQKNIRNPELYYQELNAKVKRGDAPIDPAKIKDAEYIAGLEEKYRNEIAEKEIAPIEERKEKALSELGVIQSEINKLSLFTSQEFPEPETASQEEIRTEWYQYLNLKDDPFPKAEGLQKIDPSLYDQIIVKTDVFRRYVNYAENLQGQLFKNSFFFGGFGSGKTAFFDYLSEILPRNRILPLYLLFSPKLDYEANLLSFHQQLIDLLKETCEKLDVQISIDFEHMSYEGIIRSSILEICNKKQFKGVVIIVDDLHKNKKMFESVLDFLSYLQTFTAALIRSKLDVAVYVAGLPEWRDRVRTEPRLSGSFNNFTDMPIIDEQEAFDMLNNRMVAYSKNVNKRNIITKAFVGQVYDSLKDNSSEITFRTFLLRALDELEKGNFDKVLTINPKNIPAENLIAIKNILYARLGEKFDNLILRIADSTPEHRQHCFEILGYICMEGGVMQDSDFVQRNKWEMQQLQRASLIYPIKFPDTLKWVIDRDLDEVNKAILSQFHLSLEEYVIPMFFKKPIQNQFSVTIQEFEVLDAIFNKTIDEEILRLATEIKNNHKFLMEVYHNSRIAAPTDIVGRMVTSLSLLTEAYLKCNKISFDVKERTAILQFWRRFWFPPRSMIEFLDSVDDGDVVDKLKANHIFSYYRDAFSSAVEMFRSDEDKSRIFRINLFDLNKEDYTILDKIREMSLRNEYRLAQLDLANYLEQKFADFNFNLFSLMYGDYDRRLNRVEETVRSKMQVIVNSKNSGLHFGAFNEFRLLDRSDYRGIMTGKSSDFRDSRAGKENGIEMFEHIFCPWDENALYQFLTYFGNIRTTEFAYSKDIEENEKILIVRFFENSMFILQKMNASYRLILKCLHKDVENEGLFFSFNNATDDAKLTQIEYNQEDLLQLSKHFSSLGEIKIQLDNPSAIKRQFTLDYRKFIAYLAYLQSEDNKHSKENMWLVIIDSQGSTVEFKIDGDEP